MILLYRIGALDFEREGSQYLSGLWTIVPSPACYSYCLSTVLRPCSSHISLTRVGNTWGRCHYRMVNVPIPYNQSEGYTHMWYRTYSKPEHSHGGLCNLAAPNLEVPDATRATLCIGCLIHMVYAGLCSTRHAFGGVTRSVLMMAASTAVDSKATHWYPGLLIWCPVHR